MKFLKILSLSMVVFTVSVNSQTPADSLTYHLNEYLHKKNLPGFAVVILNNKEPIYQKGFGYADIKNQKAFTPKTIQNIGSVSKTIIAVALMKAIELNYFTLETDINEILPFKVINPYRPDQVITIKDLTTHTSGIIDNEAIFTRSYRFRKSTDLDPTLGKFMKERGYTSDLSDTTLQSFLKSYLSSDGNLYNTQNFSNSKSGKRASYSNIGSALAAYLIEVKAKMSFATFTEKYVLKPLKMNNTSWLLTKKNFKQHSVPYFNKQMAFPYYCLTTYPDGGLRTSANELSKYVLGMIHSLNGNSKVLSQESVKTMFTPVFTPATAPENMSLQTRNKGVFWNLYNDGYIGHDGDDPGVISHILFNDHIGIVFISNMYLADRSDLLILLKKYGGRLVKE
ncbi:serine hydrolase domain-containing protein [Pedobacter sp. N23S346]|uniref:serine hydrolase domain-containing protein n=1 Tax=Pedobacter sp. N23S346 TaxID=3402750 RepID=UPI003AC909FD